MKLRNIGFVLGALFSVLPCMAGLKNPELTLSFLERLNTQAETLENKYSFVVRNAFMVALSEENKCPLDQKFYSNCPDFELFFESYLTGACSDIAHELFDNSKENQEFIDCCQEALNITLKSLDNKPQEKKLPRILGSSVAGISLISKEDFGLHPSSLIPVNIPGEIRVKKNGPREEEVNLSLLVLEFIGQIHILNNSDSESIRILKSALFYFTSPQKEHSSLLDPMHYRQLLASESSLSSIAEDIILLAGLDGTYSKLTSLFKNAVQFAISEANSNLKSVGPDQIERNAQTEIRLIKMDDTTFEVLSPNYSVFSLVSTGVGDRSVKSIKEILKEIVKEPTDESKVPWRQDVIDELADLSKVTGSSRNLIAFLDSETIDSVRSNRESTLAMLAKVFRLNFKCFVENGEKPGEFELSKVEMDWGPLNQLFIHVALDHKGHFRLLKKRD